MGQDGHYCVFAFRTRDDKRIQKFYSSVDHVADVADNLDKEGYDVYFALLRSKKQTHEKYQYKTTLTVSF